MVILSAFLAVAVVLLVGFIFRFRKQRDEWKGQYERLTERFRPVVDADLERARVLEALKSEEAAIRAGIEFVQAAANTDLANTRAERELRASEVATLQSQISSLRTEFAKLDEESNLQSFGFYKPRYEFADSQTYEARLEQIRDDQKEMLKAKSAALCRIEWSVNGSKVEGRKATNQTLKLMLRAFNGESDAAIARVKYNNVHVMEARIRKSHEMINGLAEVNQCYIAGAYLDLKLQELFLAHEYQEKLQDEKEEQRRIREQMRDEEIAQREIEKARLEAERDEARYKQALAKATEEAERAVGARQTKLQAEMEELQRRLAEAQTNKERAIARAQMTRSGHVYVISNVGSFGEHVYKIGMTRRLDPMERIHELSDASVPFHFDVHAVIFSEDAPALETKLHQVFHGHRLNRVNLRKEFFHVPIGDVATAVSEHHGQIEFTLAAEAAEYRKTLALIAEERGDTASVEFATSRLKIWSPAIQSDGIVSTERVTPGAAPSPAAP